ncbi:RING-type E3 ubiquitin-protein ligase PPIL2 [Nymphon striatum]|nr:RING-type E3 ubiquitin-protein ligase PPIL2 [Nymphon striatum]
MRERKRNEDIIAEAGVVSLVEKTRKARLRWYLTCTEWRVLYGGKKKARPEDLEFRRLPFDHCALSLQPFEHPLCSTDGVIFDLMNIVPFIKKYGINPVDGKPLEAKSLIKLHFHKNQEGNYHCPVLFKVFNENSHIVAIKTTGNVFSYEAVEQLNLKAKNLVELLTNDSFTKSDIITLQDPTNLQKFNLSNFHHLKNNVKLSNDEDRKAATDPTYTLRKINNQTKSILDALEKEYQPKVRVIKKKEVADQFNAAHYSTGAVSASFTSTAAEPVTHHEAAILDADTVRYTKVKKKGYVQLFTSHGPLNVELHCELVPKTCENFIKLCEKGYYNGTIFHRSIRNFMIQGGDPTGTGKGGESAWGKLIKDEFKPHLIHQGRGILSMANSGPNTNKSQFFITYRSCRHLDSKHSVFGRVVGGLDTLTAMEKVETDKKDKPKEDIKLEKAAIFVDPFKEADEELENERNAMKKVDKPKEDDSKKDYFKKKPKAYQSGVGKYINPDYRLLFLSCVISSSFEFSSPVYKGHARKTITLAKSNKKQF